MSTKPKRYRIQHAKPGELRVYFGIAEPGGHHDPDICYAWGEGTSKNDAHFLHNALTGDRYQLKKGFQWDWGQSIVKDLEARGYDPSTLKISIRKAPKA